MHYLITVEVAQKGCIRDLAAELQRAYDDGADGEFQCIVTNQPSYLVVFRRSTSEEDADYIRSHLIETQGAVRHAAQLQLADELECAEYGDDVLGYVDEIISQLKRGDGQIIDFDDALGEI